MRMAMRVFLKDDVIKKWLQQATGEEVGTPTALDSPRTGRGSPQAELTPSPSGPSVRDGAGSDSRLRQLASTVHGSMVNMRSGERPLSMQVWSVQDGQGMQGRRMSQPDTVQSASPTAGASHRHSIALPALPLETAAEDGTDTMHALALRRVRSAQDVPVGEVVPMSPAGELRVSTRAEASCRNRRMWHRYCHRL